MFPLKAVLAIVIGVLLESLLGKVWSGFRYADLALVIAVYFSFLRSQMTGMFAGAFAGLLRDAFAGGVYGTNGLIKTVLCYTIATIGIKFELENFALRMIVLTIASTLNTFAYAGLSRVLGDLKFVDLPWKGLLRVAGWQLLANVIAALILFRILDKIAGRADPEKVKGMRTRLYN